jgi:hypothetical protein
MMACALLPEPDPKMAIFNIFFSRSNSLKGRGISCLEKSQIVHPRKIIYIPHLFKEELKGF